MIVRTADYLSEIKGRVDTDSYLRQIPGRPGYSVKCKKPQLSKEQREEYRNMATSRAFKEATIRAKAEYKDPLRKKYWAERQSALIADYEKRGKSLWDANGKRRIPVRLWDFIRGEIIKELLQ